MKSIRIIPIICIMFAITTAAPCQAGLADFFNKTKDALMGELKSGSDLSHTDIIQGLKEALTVGTVNAVGVLSRTDGFFANPDVKIMLPESVRKVEDVLRAVGYGTQIDSFEQSMNRAAERAVPEAKSIFGDAISQMTIDDAKKILNGREDEATLYFKEKAADRLRELFKPIAHDSMSQVGVTKSYQDLNAKLDALPLVDQMRFDLDSYVTDRTLDGLFLMIAREEKKIREDPAARVTDLLKKVFAEK